jgi:excisionase family DNA binding protein
MEQQPIVYNLDEVAGILQVTKRTLYNHIKAGHLPAVKIGKYWRVSKDTLQDFILTGAPEIRDRDKRKNNNPA